MQAPFLMAAGAALLLAGYSGWAERRHRRRTDPDRVGWVPWLGVQVAALGAAVVLAALALSKVAR